MDQVLLDSDSIDSFMLAGKAVFTIFNPNTDKSFTYKIRRAAGNPNFVHFVSVLTGPDNTSNYTYIGYIRNGEFNYGVGKSLIGFSAPSVQAFGWFMRNRDNLGPVEVYRSNNCARCGRKLTVVSSVINYLGPECIKHVRLDR
jgi:hypothetical protein